MSNTQEFIQAREAYLEQVQRDLLGPGRETALVEPEHELISTEPHARYMLGVLFPREAPMSQESTEQAEPDVDVALQEIPHEETKESTSPVLRGQQAIASVDDDEVSSLEGVVNQTAQQRPSSMGLSFLVSAEKKPTALTCRFRVATYYKTEPFGRVGVVYPKEARGIPLPQTLLDYVEAEGEVLRLKAGASITGEVMGKDLSDFKASLKKARGPEVVKGTPRWEAEEKLLHALYHLRRFLLLCYERYPYGEKDAEKKVTLEMNVPLRVEVSPEGTPMEKCNALELIAFCQELPQQDEERKCYAVTLLMQNMAAAPKRNSEEMSSAQKDELRASLAHCLFQPYLRVCAGEDANAFQIIPYRPFACLRPNAEELSLEMLYRDKIRYATGFGTAVDWTGDRESASEVHTEFFPTYELPETAFDLEKQKEAPVNGLAYDMKALGGLCGHSKDELLQALKSVVEAYAKWVENLGHEEVEGRFDDRKKLHLDRCEEACERMRKGLKTLEENPNAWKAFQLANEAMFMQRLHSGKNKAAYASWTREDYRKKELLDGDNLPSWRPFQIAFLLMSVNSIVDDTHEDRKILDLIWFPTGGGKTEAYLGLTAFTIFYRRLEYPEESDGVAVMMRYTLRLLTAQQFERASMLICACELIRREVDDLKKAPRITLGIWIGSGQTPNKRNKAKRYIQNKQYKNFMVEKCPWCGQKHPQMYYRDKEKEQSLVIKCTNTSCSFGNLAKEEKLPILVVDEDLYDYPPSLLFATVDKFAQLPTQENVGAFFGLKKGKPTGDRPPELIIQDELHLISGALGSMVGIYEAAIDALCSRFYDPKHPHVTKIIASTATICRAEEQCKALYNREMRQFPPPGLSASDSFFAHERSIKKAHEGDVYGRMYVGLMASGATKTRMEVRMLATLLECNQALPGVSSDHEDIVDLYWTLIAYFNTLKELGKCESMTQDEIRQTREHLRSYGAAHAYLVRDPNLYELTARTPSEQLPEILATLEAENGSETTDLVLASNMISVGIDISRWNVMLMVGQPKLTSEYIQSSSRVGRRYPGVVFVEYDANQSRDRSHFEQFRSYHETFYRQVEPTNVTPFSEPVQERALHAVLIAMLRLCSVKLNDQKSAGAFNQDDFQKLVEPAKRWLCERYAAVLTGVSQETMEEKLEAILKRWQTAAGEYSGSFEYLSKDNPYSSQREVHYLMREFSHDSSCGLFPVMLSLRNVDASIDGHILH